MLVDGSNGLPLVLCTFGLLAGLRIEESTAKFYLDVAHGNMKDAIALYEQDIAWEKDSRDRQRRS